MPWTKNRVKFRLIFAQTIWLTAMGAAFWGLQMGLIQGLLSAVVADASPRQTDIVA